MQNIAKRDYKIVALPETLFEGLNRRGKLAGLKLNSSADFAESICEAIDETFAGYENIYYKNFAACTKYMLGVPENTYCELLPNKGCFDTGGQPSSELYAHLLAKLAYIDIQFDEKVIKNTPFKVVVIEPSLVVVVLLEGYKEYHDLGDFTELYKEVLDKSSTIMTYNIVIRSSVGDALVADAERKTRRSQ